MAIKSAEAMDKDHLYQSHLDWWLKLKIIKTLSRLNESESPEGRIWKSALKSLFSKPYTLKPCEQTLELENNILSHIQFRIYLWGVKGSSYENTVLR